MTPAFLSAVIARATGFAAGWAAFTAVLALASRPMRLGPGFSNLLPYAIAAILLTGAGHLARLWLNQAVAPPAPAKDGLRRGMGRAWLRGLQAFFHGTAACNNFIFLSVAYFAGIGITSLFAGRKEKKFPAPGSTPPAGYWQDLNLGKREADAYYRPF